MRLPVDGYGRNPFRNVPGRGKQGYGVEYRERKICEEEGEKLRIGEQLVSECMKRNSKCNEEKVEGDDYEESENRRST